MFSPLQIRNFWSKIILAGPNGCWIWRGRLNATGYGHFDAVAGGKKQFRAHRVMWFLMHGKMPDNVLDHLCRNRACCNPSHLEDVSQGVNNARGLSPSSLSIGKTHCIAGHAFTPDNVYANGPTGRTCKTCALRRSAEHRAAGKRKSRRKV